MAKIVQFPISPAPEKFGLQRARKKRGKDGAKRGQLDLFSSGKVVRLHQLTSFEEAYQADESGDTQKARLYYQKAIEENDCSADAWCNLGIIDFQQSNYPKAIDCFTRCLKEDPRHTEAHYNLANVYAELGNHALAKVHYGIAIELDPDFLNGYYNLGLTHAVIREYREAVDCLRKYRDLAPEDDQSQADDLIDKLSSTFG